MGMLWIAYRRLRGRPWLALVSVLSIALAVGLAVSVPVFAQAVSRAIMEGELADLRAKVERSPLAVRVYLLPSSRVPITAQQANDAGPRIGAIYASSLGIPVRSCQVTIDSTGLMLKTAQDGPYGKANTFLGNTKMSSLTGIESHIAVSDEPMGTPSSGNTVKVWMHDAWAAEMGIGTGEEFFVQPVVQGNPVRVKIAGTWRPLNPHDPYWPSDPDGAWRMALLVQPDDYASLVAPNLGPGAVGSVSWAVNLDEAHFVPELADRYVAGLKRALVRVQQLLPEAQCDVSPQPILEAHLRRLRPLTLLLFCFSVPIIGFLLYFFTLVSNIFVDGQRQVISIMVSRGMGPDQVLALSLCESLLLIALGTPLGVLAGLGAARLMGHSAGFLRFVGRSPLHVTMAGINPWLVVVTMGIALLARLYPAARQARLGIVDYAREATRPQPRPFWQRFYLDFLLVIPTTYAYLQLKQQGTIALWRWKSSGDLFRDPLLFLVPALFMLTASLLAARLFPLLMRLADRAASAHLGLSCCLTLRQLGRQGGQYVTPLLLVVASLSVGVFMASMAMSLDGWLMDRLHYRLGADAVFLVEVSPTAEGEDRAPAEASMPSYSAPEGGVSPFTTLAPLDTLLAVPGVQGATWVGSYRAQLPQGPDSILSGRFLAIDRVTFPSAASFRPDFAAESLGELMNRLGRTPDGILMSRRFLQASARSVGDPFDLKVSPDGTTELSLHTVIVGAYDYFPTVYEEETPAVVGNLGYLLDAAGGVGYYEVWLRADPALTDSSRLPKALRLAVPYFSRYRDVWTLAAEEKEQKERIGVYGTLTIGFLASLTLAGIGLLAQYHRSLQERLFRFATLRAIGLSRAQLVTQVQLEYLVVLLLGVAAGVTIGVEASRLFIPFFRVSTPEGQLPLPPLALLLDGHSTIVMAAAFALVQIAAQGGLIARAMRTELSRILRLGMQE